MVEDETLTAADLRNWITRLCDALDEIRRHCGVWPDGTPADKDGQWAADLASRTLEEALGVLSRKTLLTLSRDGTAEIRRI